MGVVNLVVSPMLYFVDYYLMDIPRQLPSWYNRR